MHGFVARLGRVRRPKCQLVAFALYTCYVLCVGEEPDTRGNEHRRNRNETDQAGS